MHLCDDTWGLVLEYTLDWRETHQRRLNAVHQQFKADLLEVLDYTFTEEDLFVDLIDYAPICVEENVYNRAKYLRLKWLIHNRMDFLGHQIVGLIRTMLAPVYILTESVDDLSPSVSQLLSPYVTRSNCVYVEGLDARQSGVWLSSLLLEKGDYRRGYPVWFSYPHLL